MGGDVRGGVRGRTYTSEQKAMIEKTYDAGGNGSSIARILGLSARGVRGHLKRTGRPTRPVRTRRERTTIPRATVRPRTADLYWVAGFIEGEGTFNAPGRHSYMGAVQVQREPLERLQKLCGGQIYKIGPGATKNTSPAFGWRICGARARGVMLTIYAMMSPKRQHQIRRALGKEG